MRTFPHKWVRQAERYQGKGSGQTTSVQASEALKHENREIKRANEILCKASAFLPRLSSTAERGYGGVY